MLRRSIYQILARPSLLETTSVATVPVAAASQTSALRLNNWQQQQQQPALGQQHFSTTASWRVAAQSATALAAAVDPGSDGLLRKLMKKFGWSDNSRSRLRVSSYMMYQSVADRIDYRQFFDTYRLPNTFNSWFLVTELHVWLLLQRAMAEGAESGEDGRFMRNCIVEAMWADVNSRAKKLGSQNPGGVRNQIQVLSQQFQAALITYDEGCSGDDRVLAGALWRRFFAMDCDDFEQLEEMVKYVRFQVRFLDSLSRQDFAVKPKIEWTMPGAEQ